MSRADESNTRFSQTAEYRRLVYKMFRKESAFISRTNCYLHRLSAIEAWNKTSRYLEALHK